MEQVESYRDLVNLSSLSPQRIGDVTHNVGDDPNLDHQQQDSQQQQQEQLQDFGQVLRKVIFKSHVDYFSDSADLTNKFSACGALRAPQL